MEVIASLLYCAHSYCKETPNLMWQIKAEDFNPFLNLISIIDQVCQLFFQLDVCQEMLQNAPQQVFPIINNEENTQSSYLRY